MYTYGHTALQSGKRCSGMCLIKLSEGPTWHEILHLQRECSLARPRWTSQANLHVREPFTQPAAFSAARLRLRSRHHILVCMETEGA